MSKKNTYNTYNFSRASERERFHKDSRDDWDSIYDEFGKDIASELRMVFPLDVFSEKERKEQEKSIRDKEKNAFRGLRTFRGLPRLTKFLLGSKQYPGLWTGKNIHKRPPVFARWCYYERQGTRIVREITLKKYKIIYD